MVRKYVAVVLCIVSLISTGRAQTARETSVFARGPFLKLSLAGPRTVLQALLPTNLGALAVGPEVRPFWNVVQRQFRGALAEFEDADRAWQALERRLLGYSGRIELELHLARRLQGWRVDYDVGGHVLLLTDGRTDMAALQKDVRRFVTSLGTGDPAAEELDDGRVCEFFGRAGDDGISLPMRYGDDHLVVFFGSRIDKAIWQGLRRLDKTPLAKDTDRARPAGDLFSAHFDLRQVGALLDDEMGRNRRQLTLMHRFLGVDTWDAGRVAVRTAGPHLQLEARVDFRPGDRGLFTALLPDIQGVPPMIQRAPPGDVDRPSAFVAAHVRFDEFYEAIIDAVAHVMVLKGGESTVAKIKAEANREMGFDISADLLAHLDTGVLTTVRLAPASNDKARRSTDGDGLCFVVGVKNDDAFARTYDKLIAHRDPRAGEPTRHAGVEITPVRFTGAPAFMARTEGFLLFALGERGLAGLRGFLDQRPARPAGEGHVDLPRLVHRVRRQAPPGFNLAGVLPLPILREPLGQDLVWECWRGVRYELPGNLRKSMNRERLAEHVAKAITILTKYRLDRLVVLGGFDRQPGRERGRTQARVRLVW